MVIKTSSPISFKKTTKQYNAFHHLILILHIRNDDKQYSYLHHMMMVITLVNFHNF